VEPGGLLRDDDIIPKISAVFDRLRGKVNNMRWNTAVKILRSFVSTWLPGKDLPPLHYYRVPDAQQQAARRQLWKTLWERLKASPRVLCAHTFVVTLFHHRQNVFSPTAWQDASEFARRSGRGTSLDAMLRRLRDKEPPRKWEQAREIIRGFKEEEALLMSGFSFLPSHRP